MKIRVNVDGCSIEQKLSVMNKLTKLTGLSFVGDARSIVKVARFIGNVRVDGEESKSTLLHGRNYKRELDEYTISYKDFIEKQFDSKVPSKEGTSGNIEQYRELYEIATFDDFVQTLRDANILK